MAYDDSVTENAPTPGNEPQGSKASDAYTRRKLFRLGLVGGASALVTHQITQRVERNRATDQIAAAEMSLTTLAAADLSETQGALQSRIDRLEKELGLYRALDRTGLDNLITGAIDLWDGVWKTVRDTIEILRAGLESADKTVERWDERLQTLREATDLLDRLLTGAEQGVEKVRQLLGRIIDFTGPVAETVEGFFGWLIARVPFGWGNDLQQASVSVTDVFRGLPLLVKDSREQVLTPITAEWTAEDDQNGLESGLLRPVREGLLKPWREHLLQLETWADSWEEKTRQPLQERLAERQTMRDEINQLQESQPIVLAKDNEYIS